MSSQEIRNQRSTELRRDTYTLSLHSVYELVSNDCLKPGKDRERKGLLGGRKGPRDQRDPRQETKKSGIFVVKDDLKIVGTCSGVDVGRETHFSSFTF